MKSCTYCGKEHPDEASVCVIDGQPLKSFVATPLVPTEEKLNSGLGIASFVLSIAVGGLMLAMFVAAGLLSRGRHGEPFRGQMIIGLAAIALVGADVVAVALSIAALFQSDRKRLLPILGLVFSLGTLLGAIGLVVLGLYAKGAR